MDTEEFIRARAKNGWSRRMTYEALGLTRQKFNDILEYIPGVVWPANNQSIGRIESYERQKGHCSDARREALGKAVEKSANMRRKMVTICGLTMSVAEAAEMWKGQMSITPRHVLWRLRHGEDVYSAFFNPKQPSALQLKRGRWHAMSDHEYMARKELENARK